jgi:hypothetical protein
MQRLSNVMSAKAGTHATILVRSETCVGPRLRGNDIAVVVLWVKLSVGACDA